MYSAWFMYAGLRRWIKAAMEIMGAVPSVIVGVIAGLWLAPHLAGALGGIMLLPALLPLLVLAVAYLAGRRPPAAALASPMARRGRMSLSAAASRAGVVGLFYPRAAAGTPVVRYAALPGVGRTL